MNNYGQEAEMGAWAWKLLSGSTTPFVSTVETMVCRVAFAASTETSRCRDPKAASSTIARTATAIPIHNRRLRLKPVVC